MAGGMGLMGEVAPHAGAWIETLHTLLRWEKGVVAPHAGAWIETWDRT